MTRESLRIKLAIGIMILGSVLSISVKMVFHRIYEELEPVWRFRLDTAKNYRLLQLVRNVSDVRMIIA